MSDYFVTVVNFRKMTMIKFQKIDVERIVKGTNKIDNGSPFNSERQCILAERLASASLEICGVENVFAVVFFSLNKIVPFL